MDAITEQDLFNALVEEIAPSSLEPGEFLLAALIRHTRLSRTTAMARMAILVADKRVSARKGYFVNDDGIRRQQWAYRWLEPEKELKARAKLKARASQSKKDKKGLKRAVGALTLQVSRN
jgi:hypothetical protein